MKITALKDWLASRARKTHCTTIVLHSTDGASAGSSIHWLRQIGLSYHYVIERDGSITKCVPVSRVALHAGKSLGPNGPDVNRYSIGIAFANRESKDEPITAYQIRAADELINELKSGDPGLKYLTMHKLISPGRKTDPAMLPINEFRGFAGRNRLLTWWEA